MLLHFSKRCRLSIRSSPMQIKFQLLPLISVVAAVKVSLATVSCAADKYSSSPSVSSSSSNISFLSFSQLIPIYNRWNSIILVISPSFLVEYTTSFFHVDFYFSSCHFHLHHLVVFVLLVLSILYISSCWFCPYPFVDFVSCRDLFFCLCWTRD